MIAAFAAIGALLIAGTQVSSVGKLSWDHDTVRLIAATLGLAVALGGVLLIILQNTRLLVPQWMTLKQIKGPVRQFFDDDPQLLLGAESVSQFEEQYTKAFEANFGSGSESAQHAGPTRAQFDVLDEKRARIVNIATWRSAELLFAQVRKRTAIAAMFAAIGAGVFAWAANPPTAPAAPARASTLVGPAPSEVRLALTPAAKLEVQSAVGAHCSLNTLRAVVVGGTKSSPEVVTEPSRHCQAERLSIPALSGAALPLPQINIE